MASETSSYEEDKELWRKLYKAFIFDNEELDALLEDISLYWNDDKAIVDTFVVKTIKRFKEENGAEQELLPEYKDDEDIEYVKDLLNLTGYIRGGCSPVGMKKKYPTVFDETCQLWEEIAVSAGARGHQMIVPPEELAQLVGAKLMDIIV